MSSYQMVDSMVLASTSATIMQQEIDVLKTTLVIIDPSVEDYQVLIDGVVEGAKVFVLDANRDGIQQITEILHNLKSKIQNPKSLFSLHIVSHGAPGTLYLGNGELSLGNLNQYAEELKTWAVDELLLYGCNVAAGDAGEEFLAKLYNLLGANIAASTTRIGHVDNGVNWNLDYQFGSFVHRVAFKLDVQKLYEGILEPVFANLPTPLALPDAATVGNGYNGGGPTNSGNTFYSSIINLSSGNVDSDLTVTVELNHTFVGDLVLFLQNPAGDYITLLHRPVGNSGSNPPDAFGGPFGDDDDYSNTILTFVDGGSDPETIGSSGSPVLSGIYAPNDDGYGHFSTGSNTLASFSGGNSAGIWRLLIGDAANSDLGELINWSIDVDPDGSANATPPTGVALITVDTILASDTTPDITGTVVSNTATIEVFLNGETYNAINNGDGTWQLAGSSITTSLSDGTYDVGVSATTLDGTAFDATTDELTIDTTAPTFQNAVVNGTSLVLNYNESLDGSSVSLTSDFEILVNGLTVTASAVTVSGSQVTLTLPTVVQPSDTVSVAYTTSGGTQDLAGNDAATFGAQTVTNSSSDTIPPVLVTTTVENDIIILTYDEALDGHSDPEMTDFVVTVNGAPVAIAQVDADGSTVTVTLSSPVSETDVVAISYTPGSFPIQDVAGNDAVAFSGQSVTPVDTIAPVLQSAEFDGNTIILTYDELLDGASDPTTTDFTIMVNGSPVAINGVNADGSTVTITLAAAVIDTDTLLIDYTPGDNPVQDVAGNDASALSGQSVTYGDRTPPVAPSLPGLDPDSDRGNTGGSRLTNNPKPGISGTGGEPGSTIELFIGNRKIGETTVDSEGNWTATPPVGLEDGTHKITARATDASGNSSPLSGALTITVDTKGALGAVISLSEPIRDFGVQGLTIAFNEKVLNFDVADIQLTLDGAPVDLTGATLTSSDEITWFLSNIPGFAESSGNYRINLSAGDITDYAGNGLSETTGTEWLTGYTADPQKKPKTGGKTKFRGRGTNGDDTMPGTNDRDVLSGRPGDDKIRGRGGNDKIVGGGGNDKASGGRGNDLIAGRNGNDILIGGSGNDKLVGGSGNDKLRGGSGDDLLFGKKGRDTMIGGKGSDTFLFRKLVAEGDTIRKFSAEDDFIDVRGIFNRPVFNASNRFAQFVEHVELVQVGSNTEVHIDADGNGSGTDMIKLVTLLKTDVTSISSENFVIGNA